MELIDLRDAIKYAIASKNWNADAQIIEEQTTGVLRVLAERDDVSIHSGPHKTPTATVLENCGAQRLTVGERHPFADDLGPVQVAPGDVVYIVREKE